MSCEAAELLEVATPSTMNARIQQEMKSVERVITQRSQQLIPFISIIVQTLTVNLQRSLFYL